MVNDSVWRKLSFGFRGVHGYYMVYWLIVDSKKGPATGRARPDGSGTYGTNASYETPKKKFCFYPM